jgi:hypothetical protein
VAIVALKAGKELKTLGGGASDEITALLATLGGLYADAVQKLLDELIESHEYRNVRVIGDAARQAALLGGGGFDLEALLASVEGALRFDAQLEYTLVIAGDQTYVLEAEVPVRSAKPELAGLDLTGTGTGRLALYSNTKTPTVTVTADDFPVQVGLKNFDPCTGTVDVTVDRMAPDMETVVIDPNLSTTIPLIMDSWTETFGEYESDGGYLFTATLVNGSENAVEESVEAVAPGSQGKVVGRLEMTVVHKPVRA